MELRLVKGVRGPGGGYFLGKPAAEISIANIICAVDEWVEFTRCRGKEDCHSGQRCLTHSLWDESATNTKDASQQARHWITRLPEAPLTLNRVDRR